MREFKFRLWDENAKRWISRGESVEMAFSQNFPESISAKAEFYLEQYTGIKDKDGTEIYEGDIIAQELIDDPFAGGYPTYIVCWDEKFLSWALKDTAGDDGNDTDLHFFIAERRKCKIIGNIHENPELLEAKL